MGDLGDGAERARVARAEAPAVEAGVHLDRDEALRRAMASDHAVLATLNRTGVADLVPVCFAIVGDALAIPVDTVKPKRSTALGRIRNLERDPRATLLVEHWDGEDWDRLWWVRLGLRRVPADGRGATPDPRALVEALRSRYRQYRETAFVDVLVFQIDAVTGWSAV